jgi:DNA-binding transcriptional ArsR family regulator
MSGRRSSAARGDRAPAPRTTLRPAPATRAADLDRLLHDRTRLAIVSALSISPRLTFNELKALTETTDGNLSVHARKLEAAGYVDCTKAFDGRLPRTAFSLTSAGHHAFQKYLDHMETIIRHARTRGR